MTSIGLSQLWPFLVCELDPNAQEHSADLN